MHCVPITLPFPSELPPSGFLDKAPERASNSTLNENSTDPREVSKFSTRQQTLSRSESTSYS